MEPHDTPDPRFGKGESPGPNSNDGVSMLVIFLFVLALPSSLKVESNPVSSKSSFFTNLLLLWLSVTTSIERELDGQIVSPKSTSGSISTSSIWLGADSDDNAFFVATQADFFDFR